MASPAFERILEIQGSELRIDQLRHRIDNHPLRESLASIDDELAERDAVMAPLNEQKDDLLKTQRRLQSEVALVETKRSEIDGKLYGGQVSAAKELLALQDEAASLLSRQQSFEDEELEMMEALEEVEAERSKIAKSRESIEQRRSVAQAELDVAVASLEQELAAEEINRDGLLEGADPELLTTYRALRADYGGVAVARVVNSACDGCNINLSAMVVDQMNKMPEDTVLSCEGCGRILVR